MSYTAIGRLLALFVAAVLLTQECHSAGAGRAPARPMQSGKVQGTVAAPRTSARPSRQIASPRGTQAQQRGLITRNFGSASRQTAPRPTAIKLRSPFPQRVVRTAPRVNGNSKSSNSKQHVYGIFRTNKSTGKTTLYKFGISGGKTRTGDSIRAIRSTKTLAKGRTYSNRALQQVSRLNRAAANSGQGYTYSTRVLRRVVTQPTNRPTARQKALAIEKQLVTSYAGTRGVPPKGNLLPKPQTRKK